MGQRRQGGGAPLRRGMWQQDVKGVRGMKNKRGLLGRSGGLRFAIENAQVFYA